MAYSLFMRRSIFNYLYHLVSRQPLKWRPLLAVQYVTYSCDFRCPYCSDGANIPYWKQECRELSPDQLSEVLLKIRKYCDYLVLTGGEPLKYPHLKELLTKLVSMKYKGVVFTTNGLGIEHHLKAISQSVDHLVVSIDTLDQAKADRWYGVGDGTLKKVLSGIDAANELKQKKYNIVISAVATPDNLADLFDVCEYALGKGFAFSVSPELQGVQPNPGLIGNSLYVKLFDHLIAQKNKGYGINGTVAYLTHMRDFKQFNCRPSTTLAVSPSGHVFYPCLEIGQNGGSLLEWDDLDRLRRDAIEHFGPEPSCPNQCQSPCALSFALILANPLTMVSEVLHMIKKQGKKNI